MYLTKNDFVRVKDPDRKDRLGGVSLEMYKQLKKAFDSGTIYLVLESRLCRTSGRPCAQLDDNGDFSFALWQDDLELVFPS